MQPAHLAEFLERYLPGSSREDMRTTLLQLFATTGTDDLAQLRPGPVLAWVRGEATARRPSGLQEGLRPAGDRLANNSIRSRAARLNAYLTWCSRQDIPVPDLADELAAIRRSYPRTYGKAQAHNPAQFLTYEQAYDQLLAVCRDGTWAGCRDELAMRLGLAGMRANEIVGLRWRHVQPDRIAWTGKGNKPRRISIGPNLADHLDRWRCQYSNRVPSGVAFSELAVIPANTPPARGQRQGINYGQPIGYQALLRIVTRRARQAELGHVAPHDLRRSAAAILHRSTTADGAHLYDLLDIQRVLGHSDPATTMRSYLEPLDTAVLDRAALTLD